jgi:lysophospholipase L1-like esterase
MRPRRLLNSLCIAIGAASAAAAAPGDVIFQPGFHQALRISVANASRTTYRMKLPVGRAGSRIRVSIKAGDGSLTVHAATVALAGTQGNLASVPVPLRFGDLSGFTVAARTRVTSDPVPFAVHFGQELYVSLDVEGALAASTINAFPDSYRWAGGAAAEINPSPGNPFMQAVGVDTVDVEAAPAAAFVALGDSITEGYVSGNVGTYVSRNDDYRQAWTTVAQDALGVPVANAGVSGQGVDEAIAGLQGEVFTLQGITDCLVLLGTNNLGSWTAEQIDARLAALFDDLRPFCRVWAGTLLPKERTTNGSYADVVARRLAVNDWIRHQARVDGVIDFEAVLAAPGDVNRFAPGLGADGIHPTVAGQEIMGREAARVLGAAADARNASATPAPVGAAPSSSAPGPQLSSGGCSGSGAPSPLLLVPLLLWFAQRARRAA